MSVLGTISDIKIPYPTEGVIRTAQLDDTVAPQDSVQLAVNMNFDRVGALQTRLGVTSYADILVDGINNYGTLRNALVPDGYSFLAQVGSQSEIVDAEFDNPSAVKIDDETIVVFWSGTDNHGYGQKFAVDEVTGALTAIGTPVEFEASNNNFNKAILVNGFIVMNVWNGASGDGFAQCFSLILDNITPMSSPLEFDTSNASSITLAQIDSTHFICFYEGTSNEGIATVFTVNTGTGEVTEPGSPTTFENVDNVDSNSCVSLGDGIHFVNFWGAPGKVQCFSVNTGTWAITAIGTALEYTTNGLTNAAMPIDAEHVVNVFEGDTGQFFAQAFLIDSGTFAVTEIGTPTAITVTSGQDLAATAAGDGEHFFIFFRTGSAGFAQLLNVDPTTFEAAMIGDPVPGFDFENDGMAAVTMSPTKAIIVWAADDGELGKGAMVQSFGDVVEGKWLYAGSGDEIYNTVTGAWTSRRSGLAEVSKPRFSQFLNYIWMVNGNEQVGGDAVATSNGGAFGTDLVPEGFPKGDFIHGGFEGRVWVANKTLGIIYYTDIVQFTPPNIYVLTYNPEVNFITTIAPQTGQSITAMYRVPRALLIFTEDTITRIYGATSIDAYPAYNVGTFSQESIIETKTGIYFHHSSGFYQFDYGSQPVEISRRIIDFVKAIPRANYENITGVYDGFDAVEWAVGQVTVEGVVFSSCVLRYTISTQVWTVYDYVGNNISAMIFYDDGTNLNHLMGTVAGKTGAMDTGFTDFGEPFYFEFIDRWRSFTEMYYQVKSISGFNIYSENAAGANLSYQIQKSGPNAWLPLGTVTQQNNSLLPNSSTEDFDVLRIRLAGNTKGAQVVVHGIEITELTIKGQDQN